MTNQPKIVVIGGGTGSFTLLSALKRHPADLTALVNMADDGGSTGVLRDELGVLPPGDIRQCLVALSTAPEELRELFNYRFPEGTFEGHSFGNLFLSAVERMTSDFSHAVRMAGDVLRIQGRVLPMTLQNCNLVLHTDTGDVVGEYKIAYSQMATGNRPHLSLSPAAAITDEARQAILDADLVVIAPGNLYGSLAPALLVDGVGQTLAETNAKVVFVCNLVNKPLQTRDYAVHDYAAEVERFAGQPVLDYVFYNHDQPDAEQLAKYALDDEFPVIINEKALREAHYQTVDGAFLSHDEHLRNQNDSFIERSLIRHNTESIATALLKLT